MTVIFRYSISADHSRPLLMNSWQFLSILLEGRKLFEVDLGDFCLRLAQDIINDAQKFHLLLGLEFVLISAVIRRRLGVSWSDCEDRIRLFLLNLLYGLLDVPAVYILLESHANIV